MRKLTVFILGAVLNVLFNITAGLIDRATAIRITRWGWLYFFMHASYLAISSSSVQKKMVAFRALYGRAAVTSYLFIGLCSAGLGMLYWAGINALYKRAFPIDAAPTSLPPSVRPAVTATPDKPSGYSSPNHAVPTTTSHEKDTTHTLEREAAEPRSEKAGLGIRAYVQTKPYPQGTTIGGIQWRDNYTDVRLDLAAGQVEVTDIDLVVQLDTSIAGVGQISQLPGFVAFPNSEPKAIWLEGTDEKGNPVSIPAVPTGTRIGPSYRVHCEKIFSNTILQLVVAAVALNSPTQSGTLPEQLFAPRRPPMRIQIDGGFKVNGRAVPVHYAHQFQRDTTTGFYQ